MIGPPALRAAPSRYTRAQEVVTRRRAEVTEAAERAAEFASDVGLPDGEPELARVREAVGGYRLALAELWPAAQALLSAREAARDAAAELEHARERLGEAAERAAEARGQAEAAAEEHRALVETAGAAVDELFRRLEEVRQALTARESAETEANRRERSALEKRGEAKGACDRLRGDIEKSVAARDTRPWPGSARSPRPDCCASPFPAWTSPTRPRSGRRTPPSSWPAPSTPNSTRWTTATARGTVSRKRCPRSTSCCRTRCPATGTRSASPCMTGSWSWTWCSRAAPATSPAWRTPSRPRPSSAPASCRRASGEILENHLLNEVAGTLQELIAAAEDEVKEMNTELTSRPTSTGMRLRLVWKPAKDAPDGLDRVREKLRQTIDAWSVDDRAAVGRLLQEQIAREHADNPASGWTEQLTHALDYRSWHTFTIQRLQEGQWRPATGPASGGERVLAASIPLFAAASAHYKSAGNPHAPRLVALDEAFAGVDDDSRAKCLGLLATFDMDVVMTSEREWGCYPQVPGLSICQLSRRDGIDAVLVTPWRWDGRALTRADLPEEPTLGQADTFT